jgi:hypothetical protein
MIAYRAYILDEDAIVLQVRVFESRSDDEAAHVAALWAAGRRHELWRGSRRVRTTDDARGSA